MIKFPLVNTSNRPVVVSFQNGRQVVVKFKQTLSRTFIEKFGKITSIRFKEDSR